MKFTIAMLGLAGLANIVNAAAVSFKDFKNGMYTIPIVNDTMDLSQAIRKAEDDAWFASGRATRAATATIANRSTNSTAISPADSDDVPGQCVPQFPSRKTTCRTRRIARRDYLRAYAQFLDWIDNGPDGGWVPKKSCKAIVWGEVVVSACSAGGPNPTCTGEFVEAMRELDTFCAPEQGGDIWITSWAKNYNRHNTRDGDNTVLAISEGVDAEADGEKKSPQQE
ncbi:hypothetical protein F5Y04DRAFT_287058 [Hypomontagnella monticulosa]|nr:hypothetical protein F5Y04DRAFT_287058 [Hypomontagnella monticulosa]